MKTLYLHIGWRKTGTSAIQSFLTTNVADHMVGDVCVIPVGQKEQGYVVGGKPLAHHRLGKFSAGAAWHAAWDDVADFVSGSSAHKFLITTEIIPGQITKHPAFLEHLPSKLAIFDRVVLSFWVRRQDEYINSLYVQAAKHGKNGGEEGDLAGEFGDADYYALLDALERAIPGLEFRPHFYGGMGTDVVGGIISDLELDASDLDLTVRPLLNARVSPEMYRAQIEVNRRAREAGLKPGRLQSALLAAYENTSAAQRGHAAIPLSIQDRVEILDRHAASNRMLCAKFDFSPALFEFAETQRLPSLDYNIPRRISSEFFNEMKDALRVGPPEAPRDTMDFLVNVLQRISA